MHEAGINVVQENCKNCHYELNQQVGLLDVNGSNYLHGEGKLCWDCHREVPHGRVKGLATTPNARAPMLASPVPEWIKEYLKKTTE
jgi:cytochrome c nitrite reductase small subunit